MLICACFLPRHWPQLLICGLGTRAWTKPISRNAASERSEAKQSGIGRVELEAVQLVATPEGTEEELDGYERSEEA